MKKLLTFVTATALLLSTLTFGAVSHAEPTSVTLPDGKQYLSWDTNNMETCVTREHATFLPFEDPDSYDNIISKSMKEKVTTDNGWLKINNAYVDIKARMSIRFNPDYELFKYICDHSDCQLGFTVKTISASKNLSYSFDFGYGFDILIADTDTQKEHLVVIDGKSLYETKPSSVYLNIYSPKGDLSDTIDIEISPVVIFNENISTDKDYIVKADFKNPYDYGENLLTDWSDMKYIVADGKDISDKVKWYQSGLSVDTGVIDGGFKKITAEFNIDSKKFTELTSKQWAYRFCSEHLCFLPNFQQYVGLDGTNEGVVFARYYLYNSKYPENAVKFYPNETYYDKDFKDCEFDTLLIELCCPSWAEKLKIERLDFTLRPIYADYENITVQPTEFTPPTSTTPQTYDKYDLNQDNTLNAIDIYVMAKKIAGGDHNFTALDMRTLFLQIA